MNMDGIRTVQDKLDLIWPGWKIDRILGSGGFGKVYRIVRTDELGYHFESALKIVSVPSGREQIGDAINRGMDETAMEAYFQKMVEDMAAEFVLMSRLKGLTNIVSYEDHAIIKDEGQLRWDIYIRMEYLTPLFEYTRQHSFTVRDTIKLGIDMCNALEVCEQYHIIHRDIKPQNILVSDMGNYKLGDFGIARQLVSSSLMISTKGTPMYMAPEVYKGRRYNSTVDIYSLGMVLYYLLNNNRGPFLPPYPSELGPADDENALVSRMNGEPFPWPAYAEYSLGQVILKACAYQPEERYQKASQFRNALQSILDMEDFENWYPAINIMPGSLKTTNDIYNREENIQALKEDKKQLADVTIPDMIQAQSENNWNSSKSDYSRQNIYASHEKENGKKLFLRIAIILIGLNLLVLLAVIAFMALRLNSGGKKEKETQVETTTEEKEEITEEEKEEESADEFNTEESSSKEGSSDSSTEGAGPEATAEKENDSSEEPGVSDNGQTPFYGIWCHGSEDLASAEEGAEGLRREGLQAEIFITTDWENLNKDRYYVVTAGVYSSKEEAEDNLAAVADVYPDAYVKYSGNWKR